MSMIVPILPIPNLVFFPNTSIPILVIEPVYVRMIRDCVENGWNLGISMAEPVGNFGGQLKYTPQRICGMGRPMILEEIPEEGAIKVLVRGLSRIELLNVQQNLPYLIYEAEEIPDQRGEEIIGENKVSRLKGILNEWVLETIPDSLERETFYHNLESIYHIVDYICMFLIHDREMRQILLENTSLYEKIQMLNSLLNTENPWFEDVQVTEAIKSFESIEKTSKIAH